MPIGLQKYSKVSVQVAAETVNGAGPFSHLVTALTSEDCRCQILHLLLEF